MDKKKVVGRIEHLLFYLCGLSESEAGDVLMTAYKRIEDKKYLHKIYCEKYDAYFDERDGSWMERKCSDPGCEFCSKRPVKHKSHKWTSFGKVINCGGMGK